MTTLLPHAIPTRPVLPEQQDTPRTHTNTVYDSIAQWYSHHIAMGPHLHETVHPAHSALIPTMLQSLPMDFERQYILDVCCGTGIFTRALAEAGAQHVIGIDLAHHLLLEAVHEEKRVQSVQRPRITYLLDDATQLTTQPSCTADIVTCCLGVTDVPDLRALYRSIAHVLRPGGTTILSLIHPAAPCSCVDGSLEFLPIAYHEEAAYTTGNPKSVRGRVPTYHRPVSLYLSQATKADLHLEDLIECPANPTLREQQPTYQSVPYGLVLTFTKAERAI